MTVPGPVRLSGKKLFFQRSVLSEEDVLKKGVKIILIVSALILAVLAGMLIRLKVRTDRILTDVSSIREDERYSAPVSVLGLEVITQDVSCGYACIEMFSAWNGGDLTEEDLYGEYGRVVTSTGDRFCEEMNRRFPEYTTTIRKYLTNGELIGAAYENLSNGIPVPFEWAARYGDDWTLHYSLLIGMDLPNDRITVANPYGYVEEIPLDEFLRRTSFEAYEDMPVFLKLAFAAGVFEKNTIFTVQ